MSHSLAKILQGFQGLESSQNLCKQALSPIVFIKEFCNNLWKFGTIYHLSLNHQVTPIINSEVTE